MVKSKAAQEATRRYEAAHNDVVRVLLPKGTKDMIRSTGESINGFINRVVLSELQRIEGQEEDHQHEEEDSITVDHN